MSESQTPTPSHLPLMHFYSGVLMYFHSGVDTGPLSLVVREPATSWFAVCGVFCAPKATLMSPNNRIATAETIDFRIRWRPPQLAASRTPTVTPRRPWQRLAAKESSMLEKGPSPSAIAALFPFPFCRGRAARRLAGRHSNESAPNATPLGQPTIQVESLHKLSGLSPVLLATRASAAGPISASS